jgi:hypothetical protein
LRGHDPDALPYSYYGNILDYTEYTLADHAIPMDTPRVQPQGPLAVPGAYAAILTVDGTEYRQDFTVTLDPRVHATQPDLEDQFAWARKAVGGMSASSIVFRQIVALRAAIEDRQKALTSGTQGNTNDSLTKSLKDAANRASAIQEGPRPARGVPVTPGVGPVNRDMARVYWMVESGDIRPSESAKASVQELCSALDKNLEVWRQLNSQVLKPLNVQLIFLKLAPLPIVADVRESSSALFVTADIPSSPACGK